MLDLEDFNSLISIKEKIEQEDSKQEIEKKYIEEIKRLKSEYEQKLKEEVKNAYEKGFEEGLKQADLKLKKEYQKQLQDLLKEKEEEIEYFIKKLSKIEESINERYEKYINSVREIITDSLSEILEFLYINTKSHESVINAIQTILLEFKEKQNPQIQVGKELYPLIKNSFSNVVQNPELENDDFIIDFGDFQIENKVKEKLKIVKDEIKREIKKLT